MEQQKTVRSGGVVLMVIGVVLFIVAVLPISRTDTILNESHTINGYSVYDVSWVFSGQEIHMTFTVSGGTVDFWVMDDHEYNNHFRSGESFDYYVTPSVRGAYSMEKYWTPPVNERTHFVWDNNDSTSKVVSMIFSSDYSGALLPDWARFVTGALSGILFFAGLSKVLSTRARGGPPVSPPTIPSVVVEEKRFCRYCGAENKHDAVFCDKCGKNIG